MGWDAAIFGRVKLGASARERWLAGSADSKNVRGANKLLAKARFGPRRVVEAITALTAARMTHLELVTDRSPIRIAAIVTDDQYLDWAPTIAALFGAAFAQGGTGKVVYGGLEGVMFGTVQTSEGVEAMPRDAVRALDRDAEMRRLNDIYRGSAEDDDGAPGRAGADKIWVLNPFTKKPHRVRAIHVTDVALVRAALKRAGFDPDTGKPEGSVSGTAGGTTARRR